MANRAIVPGEPERVDPRWLDDVTGDVLKTKLRGEFNVIAANLFSELLIAALPIWSRHLSPDGTVILSGILRSQEPSVARALQRNGFAFPEIRRRGQCGKE